MIHLFNRSRNFIASKEGVWSGGTSNSYPMETCPHCLNRGGTAGQCGIVGDRSYDDNLNFLGEPMAPAPQARFSQGDEIEVDVVLTAHHMGHFEFSACPIEPGGVAAGDCFAQHPLAFVSDPLYGAPKDAMYPNRAYIAPPGRATTSNNGTPETHYLFRLKLPDNLAGDLVLLQWHYFTANSCTYPGYDTYAFPADWGNMQSGTEVCKTISPDGNGAPGMSSVSHLSANFASHDGICILQLSHSSSCLDNRAILELRGDFDFCRSYASHNIVSSCRSCR